MKVKPEPSRFSGPRIGRPRRSCLSFSAAPLCAFFLSLCRATHQETTVKPCWFSAEGKINSVTSLQLLLQTSVRNHQTTAHTLKLRHLTSVFVVTAVCSKPKQAKPSDSHPKAFQDTFCLLSFPFCLRLIMCFSFFYDKLCYLKMFRWMWPCMTPLTSH